MLASYQKLRLAAFLFVLFHFGRLSRRARPEVQPRLSVPCRPNRSSIPNATVEIQNPVSGFDRTTTTERREGLPSRTSRSILITLA